jgi:hypothetical protein
VVNGRRRSSILLARSNTELTGREKCDCRAEIVEPQREAASDADALLTHPGMIRQGSGIFPQRKPSTGLRVGYDLGANKPCRMSVFEISQSKRPRPCNRPECWLQILNYKSLTNQLTPSFCEGNFMSRRLGEKRVRQP